MFFKVILSELTVGLGEFWSTNGNSRKGYYFQCSVEYGCVCSNGLFFKLMGLLDLMV